MDAISLGEHPSAELLVTQATDEFLQQLDRGERPDLEAFCQRYPAVADVLRNILPALGVLQRPDDPTRELSTLGDFRLLGEIGRGGMGVVYEALQTSLNRRVALKVLPFAAALDIRQLKRFQTEAQAAAQLHHTNIVPVYAVGSERGVHYYAMQYIDGRNLASVLQGLRRQAGRPGAPPAESAGDVSADARTTVPVAGLETDLPALGRDYFRAVARLGVQAAEGLAFAHGSSIIHRDIKPANLLLDSAGRLWIADFGLARCRTGADLTLTGDLVGTLRYMSPEQAMGKPGNIDHRTDVYSLGATLYELLTLQPLFEGEDRAALLHQVAAEEPRPPGRINPAVPADLETIVLKALAKSPDDRYADAAEMAADLQRFLDFVPVRARRPTALQRLRKWARRHRPLVLTAGVAAVLALAVAVGALAASVAVISGERDRASQAEQERTNQLFESLLAEAHARRLTSQVGKRFASIDSLDRAALLYARESLGEERAGRLRDAYLASLLPDLRRVRGAPTLPPGTAAVAVVDSLEYYARADTQGEIQIARLAEGGAVGRVTARGTPIPWMAFGPGGRLLAALYGGGELAPPNRLAAWDWRTGENVLGTEVADVQGMPAFSRDGAWLAVGRADGAVDLFPLTGDSRKPRRLSVGAIPNQLAFDSTGRRLAVSSIDGLVQVRDVVSDRLLTTLPHGELLAGIAWHPDGDRLATGGARNIYLWSVAASRRLAVLEGHQALVTGLGFSPRGNLLASSSWDSSFKILDVEAGRVLVETVTPGLSLPPVFAPDGRTVASPTEGGQLGLWEVADGHECRALAQRPGLPAESQLRFSPDGRHLAAAQAPGGISFWDWTVGREIGYLPLNRAISIFLSGEALFSVSQPHGIQRWPLTRTRSAGREHWRFGPPQSLSAGSRPAHLDVSADGTKVLVALADEDGAAVIDLARGGPPRRLERHPFAVFVSLTRDGRLAATGTWHGTGVNIWETATGRALADLPIEGAATVHFSPDGRLLVTATKDRYTAWDVATWKSRWTVDRAEGPVGWAAFAPAGDVLAVIHSYRPGEVRLLDADTGRLLARLCSPGQAPLDRGLSFSPDGHHLAVGCVGTGVYVWDLGAARLQLVERGLDWSNALLPLPAGTRDALLPPVEIEVVEASADDRRRLLDGLRQAIKEDPEDARAHNLLAWRLATAAKPEDRDPKQAVELARKATALRPYNSNYWNTLGAALAAAGAWQEALQSLEKAVELGGGTAYDWYYLAMAHHRLGRPAQARLWYDQAVRATEKDRSKEEELGRLRAEAEKVLRQPP
jgi:serine/threonine protein kinase/WD40 repeat protein